LKKIHEEERIPSYKNLKKYLKYITIQKIKIKIEIEIKIKIKIHDKYNIIVLSMNDIMICTWRDSKYMKRMKIQKKKTIHKWKMILFLKKIF